MPSASGRARLWLSALRCDKLSVTAVLEASGQANASFGADYLDKDVAQETDPGDKHDHHPDVAGTYNVKRGRAVRLVWKDGKNDGRNHGELQGILE